MCIRDRLDSIAWMCERGKNADAVQMVHALARLFRISISRGQDVYKRQSLGIVGGTTIRIIADGADEQAAVDGLVKLVSSGFAE